MSIAKRFLLLSLIVPCSVSVLAEEYYIKESANPGASTYTALQYGHEIGAFFPEIVGQMRLDSETSYVGLFGSFSPATNLELLDFYRRESPRALAKALASSGNRHNPALKPIIRKFSEALGSTRMFREIEKELDRRGYKVTLLGMEKFTIYTSATPPQFFVGEISLRLDKNPD